MEAYCAALRREIRQMGQSYAQARVSTVFLGGGTPTLVPPRLMAPVLEELRRCFALLPDAEFTSEGNPGTLTGEWLDMAMAHGLNRLSLGVQAAQDELLKRIGRIHTFQEAQHAVRHARAHGVQNLNLDAMFGLPGQTQQHYLDTLNAFAQLGAQHISAYSLILEEGTPLQAQVQAGQIVLPGEDETAEMYETGIERLQGLGYERYEVSNFAKPGRACRHNIGYWQGEWYLGLGAAAHSMLPPDDHHPGAARVRTANTADVQAYIKEENPPKEVEGIAPEEAMFESMMLALRTTAGVNAARFERQHGVMLRRRYGAALDELAARGLGCWTPDGYALTPRGIEVQNEVLMHLMD